MWCAVLAGDNDVIIAGPILEQSEVLTDEDLIEIARSMSQDHLHPIAGRHYVSESVSEILVDRGESRVLQPVAGNSGAQFSRLTLVSPLGKAGAGRRSCLDRRQPYRHSARAVLPVRRQGDRSRSQTDAEVRSPAGAHPC